MGVQLGGASVTRPKRNEIRNITMTATGTAFQINQKGRIRAIRLNPPSGVSISVQITVDGQVLYFNSRQTALAGIGNTAWGVLLFRLSQGGGSLNGNVNQSQTQDQSFDFSSQFKLDITAYSGAGTTYIDCIWEG